MWSYYGSKTNVVKLYPKPTCDHIIEPFAGAGKYALRYFDRQVTLVDKYPDIITIWEYLKSASEKDILSLPKIKRGETLNDYNFDSPGAKLLMGFVIAKGGQSPRVTPIPNATIARPNTINFTLNKIASQLFKIRHWNFVCGSYEDIPDQEATWYIDPPYQFGGHVYVKSNKDIDFIQLGKWCKSRKGQVIVCENSKADWLPFIPVGDQKGTYSWQTEVIWTNQKTSYGQLQNTLF